MNTSREEVDVHTERGDPNVPPPRPTHGDTVVLMAVGAGLNEVASSELADITR